MKVGDGANGVTSQVQVLTRRTGWHVFGVAALFIGVPERLPER